MSKPPFSYKNSSLSPPYLFSPPNVSLLLNYHHQSNLISLASILTPSSDLNSYLIILFEVFVDMFHLLKDNQPIISMNLNEALYSHILYLSPVSHHSLLKSYPALYPLQLEFIFVKNFAKVDDMNKVSYCGLSQRSDLISTQFNLFLMDSILNICSSKS